MGLPSQPVTLNAEEIKALNQKVALLRHDINNHIGLMIAAIEIIQVKPETIEKMMDTLMEQPTKITASMQKFSDEFEKTFGITRPY